MTRGSEGSNIIVVLGGSAARAARRRPRRGRSGGGVRELRSSTPARRDGAGA